MYVQRIPPKPKSGYISTWHKMDAMDSARTAKGCNILIRPNWIRQEEPPPSGQSGCYRCFLNGRTP